MDEATRKFSFVIQDNDNVENIIKRLNKEKIMNYNDQKERALKIILENFLNKQLKIPNDEIILLNI